MIRRGAAAAFVGILGAAAFVRGPGDAPDGARAAADAASPPVLVGALPLVFEPNVGQTADCVRFLARTPDGTVFVTDDATVLSLRGGAVRSRFADANPAPVVVGENPLATLVHHFDGDDSSRWRTRVPTVGRVRCRGVYPGVDVAWYGRDGRLEYDVVVAPGADPSVVALTFDGADAREIDAAGDLVLRVGDSRVVHRRPFVYQETGDGSRRTVGARWALDGDRVRFALDGYDRARSVVIDPVIEFGTFLGGSVHEIPRQLVRDASGNSYVCGQTTSTDFPVVGGVQPMNRGRYDAFVTKLGPGLANVVFSTYMGGGEDDEFWGVALDPSGNVCLAGNTFSTDFPTTSTRLMLSQGMQDVVITKIAPAGDSLVWSTYLGGPFNDTGRAVAADAAGNVVVLSQAPAGVMTTAGVLQTATGGGSDAHVAKVAAAGNALVWGTYVGGDANETPLDLTLDAAGNVYLVGSTQSSNFPLVNAHQPVRGDQNDAFLAVLNPTATALVFSTYLGGVGQEDLRAVAIGGDGHVYVGGVTLSAAVPTLAPIQATFGGVTDGLFAEFTATGTAVHVSYLGGSSGDLIDAAAVDAQGRVWLGGQTSSANFPAAGIPPVPNAGQGDAFFARLDPTHAALEYSTTVGGSGSDQLNSLVVDADGKAYGMGLTNSAEFPATEGAYDPTKNPGNDAFVMTAPEPDTVDSYFLPRTVLVKPNADPQKWKLAAAGFFDTGSADVDFTHGATIEIGDLAFPIPDGLVPNANRTKYTYTAEGLTFLIIPNRAGSSRAKFRLKQFGDIGPHVPLDGELALRFANDVVDGTCRVTLQDGLFRQGRKRGALVRPNLFVVRAQGKVKGAGQDALTLAVGLATNGTTPASAPTFRVAFGALDATIDGDDFVRSGDKYVFRGDANGVTSVTLDYPRETIVVKAKHADLGPFDEGANATTIQVSLGAEARAVSVRTVKKKTALRY